MEILYGDIFNYADSGEYDVIIQGCNCFSKQGAGIAVEFNKRYNTLAFPMELKTHELNNNDFSRFNKLGCIDDSWFPNLNLDVVNCYSQYYPGKDARLWALATCFRKLNIRFKGKKLLTPAIGCGIGGLDIKHVTSAIDVCMKDVDVYWVQYEQQKQ